MNAGIYIVWIVIAVCSSALLSDAKYQCYQWTAEDRKEMGTKPSVASEKAQCEKRRNTFTGGDNGNYTGCGECRCCMKVKYQCYKWTAKDRKEMGTKPSVASEKAQCEKRRNTFTGGDNGNYTGCGECRCCVKVLPVTPVTRGTSKALVMLCSILKKVDEKDMTKSHCSP